MGINEIAWPGPRPLAEDDELAGRQEELKELFDVCRTYEIVQLTAWSGAGKTSFVKAGLLPLLKAAGAVVPPMIPWPDVTAALGLGRFELDAVTSADKHYRIAIGAAVDGDGDAADALREIAGSRSAVVVLDQFEELLRYQPLVGDALLRLVGDIAKRTRIAHIIVCRSEYLQALRPVEESGASTWPLYLSEITDPAALLSIITEPAKAQKVDVDPNASKQLTDWWSEARLTVFRRRAQRVGAEGVADVGLLHFQALLWSFKHWAVKRGLSSRITKQDVNDYAAERLGRPEVGADDGLRLFEDALAGYVRGRAGLLSVRPTLRTGERTRTLDWENGPRVMLARVAPAMMATGYKQAQSLYSLIPYALSDELKPTPARQLSQQLLELGTSEDPSGSRGEVTRRFGVQGAGIAADWDKREVVEEMIDCLHAALQIMSGDANILREFDRPGQPIYELVHDGMGTALAKWAQSFVEQAEAKVGVIAAQPGRFMDASIDGEALLKMSGSERRLWGGVEEHAKRRGQAVLRGLRWPASLVKATIKDVVFQGCDFVGASFSECKLQNVTFEHCKLIGAVMINCELDGVTFVGGQSPDIEENQDEWLDLFTIKYTDRYFERESDASSRAAAKVTFEGLKLTTGLFLQGLITGTWTLTRSNIRNLVITAHQHVIDAHEEVGIVFERTFVVPLSVYSGGVSVTRDASSSIFRLSTD